MARMIVQLAAEQTLPYVDAAQTFLTGEAAIAWQQMAGAFPQLELALDRMLSSQSGSQLQALLDRARTMSGVEPPDLTRLRVLTLPNDAPVSELAGALRNLPFVNVAYPESDLTQPSVDPSDDPLTPLQGYLGVAPAGVEAFTSLAEVGGDGAGVTFFDIERGWNLSHEDLAGANVNVLNESVPGNDQHSTACLGIVLAQDNNKGVIGIAPNVRGAIASSQRPTLAEAFVLAAGFLVAGDVLLIEEQTSDAGGPVETDPHIARLISVLTLLGIIVIEPAGNGAQNLDFLIRADGTSFDRSGPLFFDSGAILVGARHALLDRSRMPFSSFGNRVDCHAWGESIVTTSAVSGPLGPYTGLNPLAGDTGFGGTSGASAIVAGCAVALQGIARARGVQRFPKAMRDLLAAPFNTASNNPTIDLIGVMPNLKVAIANM